MRNVLFASENTPDFLGCTPEQLFDGGVESWFDHEFLHALRNVAGHKTIRAQRESFKVADLGRGTLEFSAHRSGDRLIVECTPVGTDAQSSDALNSTRAALAALHGQDDLDGFLSEAVKALRILTRYDRVMAYRFLPDGAGEVVAESRSSIRESFLGLRYPAWDIPKQARELYLKVPIRFIADLTATDAGLVAAADNLEPLDMSLAVLRGTSPVHKEYLGNMGVAATMSLPIIVDKKLWGLFALHHYSPRFPDPELLKGCEMASILSGTLIERATHRRTDAIRKDVAATSLRIADGDGPASSSSEYWQLLMEDLRELVASDGVLHSIDTQATSSGLALKGTALTFLQGQLAESEDGFLAVDNLLERYPKQDFGEAAGVLSITISEAPLVTLHFLRRAIHQSISWAGEPVKEVVKTDAGARLAPRGSFKAYIEESSHRSEAWTTDDVETAQAIQVALQHALASEDSRRLEILVHELNHRVRNILSLVRSLAHQAKASAYSVEDYTEALDKRLEALATAHDLLTDSKADGISLSKLLSSELAPYSDRGQGKPKLHGPPVNVRADAGSMFALVLHELTSNAVKYGALSVQGGAVSVAWEQESGGLQLRWRETKGPRVEAPSRRGFGMTIIEKTFPHEFGGTSDCRFAEVGFEADLWLPDAFVDFQKTDLISQVKPPEAELPAAPPVDASGFRRALVLEDSFLLASEMESLLLSIGFESVDVVSNNADAMSCLERSDYSIAVLDLNLKGEMSIPVANRLQSLRTPFLFVTGYGNADSLPMNLRASKVLIKPLLKQNLVEHLETMQL